MWLLIGAIGGAWMLSGVVPTMNYYGMQIVNPKIFLVICCVVSIVTGGSWTTIATMMISCYGNTSVVTSNDMLTELVATRGMMGMMNTIWLIICAMCFGGVMMASGMIANITSLIMKFIKRTLALVTSTVFAGLFSNVCISDQYLSIILTCNIFKDYYDKNGYESRLLSRSAEDSATVTSPLIPWNTCGMTHATVMNVATLSYLPYCIFNILSPMMSIIVTAIGWKIYRKFMISFSEYNPVSALRESLSLFLLA